MGNRKEFIDVIERKNTSIIPADIFESGIHPNLQNKLLKYYGLRIDESEKLYDILNACTRRVNAVYSGKELEQLDVEYEPIWPHPKVVKSIWGTPEGIDTYSDQFARPFANVDSIDKVYNFNWPTPDMFDYTHYSWIDNPDRVFTIDEWKETYSDFGRIISGWSPLFCRIMDMFGMEKGLLVCALQPELILAATEKIGVFLVEYYENIAKNTANAGDVLAFGDDFSGQTGMLISPEFWREAFLPVWKKLFSIAHKYNMKTMMHMCGCITDVLPDLIDAGLDIYQNVQISAGNTNIHKLKSEFGKDIIFYGGIDIQKELAFCDASGVKDYVKRTMDVLGKGGGYIVSSTHFLLDDIPVENVVAMYEAVIEYNN